MHDSARQDEGDDHWDAASAKLLEKQLEAGNSVDYRRVKGDGEMVPSVVIRVLVDAIAHKDRFDGPKTSIEKICVHDADCLEINRIPGMTFDPSYLWFLKDSSLLNHYGKKFLEQIVQEATSFIALTESPGLKRAMETQSDDYLGDLCKILVRAQAMTGKYTAMCQMLKPLLDALATGPLQEQILSAMC
jgi:hypothetical protein